MVEKQLIKFLESKGKDVIHFTSGDIVEGKGARQTITRKLNMMIEYNGGHYDVGNWRITHYFRNTLRTVFVANRVDLNSFGICSVVVSGDQIPLEYIRNLAVTQHVVNYSDRQIIAAGNMPELCDDIVDNLSCILTECKIFSDIYMHEKSDTKEVGDIDNERRNN